MAKKAKPVEQPALDGDLLAKIVANTQSKNLDSFAYDDALKALEAEGYVETNPNGPDGDGNIQAIATAKAIEEFGSDVKTEKAKKAVAEDKGSAFEVEEISSLPARKRAGGGRTGPRGSIYPFDKLAAPRDMGDGSFAYSSFHIPVTEKLPAPWKSLNSTVSGVNKRFATKVGEGQPGASGRVRGKFEYSQKFEVRKAEDNDPKGPGARVIRVK